MLSRAFASASSPSLLNSCSPGHGNLTHSLSSTQLLSESNDEELQYDVHDDSLHGPNVEIEQRHGSEDMFDVFGAAGEMDGLPTTAAICSPQTAVAVSGVDDLHRYDNISRRYEMCAALLALGPQNAHVPVTSKGEVFHATQPQTLRIAVVYASCLVYSSTLLLASHAVVWFIIG